MKDTSGPKLPEPFAFFDPASSSVRMSQLSWDLEMSSEKSSLTFPKQAMWDSGQLYELRTLELLTDGNDSFLLRTPQARFVEAKKGVKLTGRTPQDPQVGLADQIEALRAERWPAPLLPTPAAADGTGGKQHKKGTFTRTGKKADGTKIQVSLRDALNLLPTPRANAERSSRAAMVDNPHWSAPSLEQAVEIASGILPREFTSWEEVPGKSGKLLPTPQAQDTGRSPEAHLKMKAELPGGARTQATSLAVVAKLLPTPSAGNFNDGEDLASWEARRKRNLDKHNNGNGQGTPLTIAVRLLPTPAARDWKGGTTPVDEEATRRSRGEGGASDLPSVVKLLPTPTSADYKGATNPESCQDWDQRGVNLPEAAQGLRVMQEPSKLLSTPQARDWKGEPGPAHGNGGLNRQVKGMLPTPTGSPTTGNGHARNLGKEAKLLATPRTSDVNGTGKHGEGGMDLRTQISEIGDPTPTPSPDGSQSLDDEPLTLWTNLDD